VKWNDREVNAELHRWVETSVTDQAVRRAILTPITDPRHLEGLDGYFGEDVFYVGQPRRQIMVQWPKGILKVQGGLKGTSLGDALLTHALEYSNTLAYRFNILHVIPIKASSLDWQDRTGVADVRFEPDSQQAKAWLQPVSEELFLRIYPGERFREMFAPENETGIVIDTDAIIDPPPHEITVGMDPGPYSGLARRDLLGLHLDREGCYCEQHGNTLVIRRHE